MYWQTQLAQCFHKERSHANTACLFCRSSGPERRIEEKVPTASLSVVELQVSEANFEAFLLSYNLTAMHLIFLVGASGLYCIVVLT